LEWLSDPNAWLGLATLTALEIVLGIDNIVFISILSARLEPERQPLARRVGLGLAMLVRIALLFSLSWVMALSAPLFEVSAMGLSLSGRDLVLFGGGLFLIAKATWEIHDKLEGAEKERRANASSMRSVLAQIVVLDIVFSLDSVITAVGMVDQLGVMVTAVVIAVIHEHPTMKMLALAFLLLIGVMLVAEGLHQHVPKGYIYFAMAFSLGVELLNLRLRAKAAHPVELREPYQPKGVGRLLS
jgi:predicted tellurium resistance membrane protein TerC